MAYHCNLFYWVERCENALSWLNFLRYSLGKLNFLHLLQAQFAIFDFIHEKLNSIDSEKFPKPAQCSSMSLEKMLGDAEGPVSLVLDEGNVLAKIPENDLKMLLQVFRSLKHQPKDSKRPNKGLASLVLIGTEELSTLVKEGDKLISPFSHVSLTAYLLESMSDFFQWNFFL